MDIYENYKFDLVGKIGSMALIRKEDSDIDYNIFSRIGTQLKPGMIWVSSGATEIGRIDYMKRNGIELSGLPDDDKTDYAAQGQTILMQNYRQFINPNIGVRQVLLEHTHFNDPEKREHIKKLFIRCALQNSIPIVNYNDPVSEHENRKMELTKLRTQTERETEIVECIDNDETAAVIAGLVQTKILLILTSTNGIYENPQDEKTLIRNISGKDSEELIYNISKAQKNCIGASRKGAQGAFAKLEYMKKPAVRGTIVIIGNGKYSFDQLIKGTVPCTRIAIE